MSWPRKAIRPRFFAIRPMIAFIVVDLPAPLRPTRATHSPAPTPRETPKRTCAWPYQPSSDCTSSIALLDNRRRSEGRPAAEVDLADARVVAHRRGRPLGDEFAARQHDDAVGMGEDDVHAVLGEEDAYRLLVRQAALQRHQLVPLAWPHAGGRLVHEEQARPVGERDRQLDALDVAVRQ